MEKAQTLKIIKKELIDQGIKQVELADRLGVRPQKSPM